jgi:hypothetical protein
MNALRVTAVILIAMGTCLWTHADNRSLFPDPAEVNNEKPSLESAISQFEGVIADSTAGRLDSLRSNDQYNQQRMAVLELLLAEKRQYLQSMPDLVSSQFEDLMKRFAGSDQQTRNKMADDLYARWQAKEAQVRQEIKDLEEQLGVTTGRLSEGAVERQMLEISGAMANSENALRQKQSAGRADPDAESPAFTGLRRLATQRMLSRIQGVCSIQVKSLEDELSINYLDN